LFCFVCDPAYYSASVSKMETQPYRCVCVCVVLILLGFLVSPERGIILASDCVAVIYILCCALQVHSVTRPLNVTLPLRY